MKKEFTGQRSYKGWETLPWTTFYAASRCYKERKFAGMAIPKKEAAGECGSHFYIIIIIMLFSEPIF